MVVAMRDIDGVIEAELTEAYKQGTISPTTYDELRHALLSVKLANDKLIYKVTT
jgi:hypothetical protein